MTVWARGLTGARIAQGALLLDRVRHSRLYKSKPARREVAVLLGARDRARAAISRSDSAIWNPAPMYHQAVR